MCVFLQQRRYPDTATIEVALAMKSTTPKKKLETHKDTKKLAYDAQRSGKPANGVRGHSWFLFVPKFHIIENVAIDYMHRLVLGVVKMLVSLWFDSSHHKEAFNISKQIDKVDERIAQIAPPHCLSKMTRCIGSHLKFWKASEYRSFLLFYSIPCLIRILLDEYFHTKNLLLNEVSFILLSQSISSTCLRKASVQG